MSDGLPKTYYRRCSFKHIPYVERNEPDRSSVRSSAWQTGSAAERLARHGRDGSLTGMTKTAQVAVARGIAESLAGTGVTANRVLAGPTASEGAAGFVTGLGEATGKMQAADRRRML